MKKVVRCLLISSLVLPILTFSKASANDDHGYGLYDRERSRNELDHGLLMQPRLDYSHSFTSPRDRYFGSPSSRSFGGGGTPSFGGGSPSYGAPDPGGSGGGESAPIDGGISLLLAAGLGLGMKKAIGKNKAAKQESNDTAE